MDLDARERSLLAAAERDPRKRLGPYVLLEELGRGGMGVVQKGFDPRVGRRVAIKLLLDPEANRHLARFRAEAQLASRLQHPNLAKVYELSTDDPRVPYMVLQFVPGQTLLDLIRSRPDGLEPEEIRRYVGQIADAIAAAHDVGVLHRDLKPANVMITPEDQAVVLDFGLAKSTSDASGLTRTGELVGTVNYMAPELATDDHAPDVGVDVYGIGAILYECLTGQAPYLGASQVNVLSSLIHRPPHPPSQVAAGVDPALEEICLRCIARDPGDRYSEAALVAEALREAPSGARRGPSNAPFVVLGLGALGLLGGAALLLSSTLPGRTESTTATSPTRSAPTTAPRPSPLPSPTTTASPSPTPTETATDPPSPSPRPTAVTSRRAEAEQAYARLERALSWTRRPIDRDRKRETALQRQGSRRVGAALKALKAAAAAAPNDPETGAILAEGYWRSFRLEPAIRQARRVLKVDPGSLRAQRTLLRAACERYYLFCKTQTIPVSVLAADMDRARGLASGLARRPGNDVVIRVCLDMVTGRGNEAYARLQRAIREAPSPDLHYWTALLMVGSSNPDAASRKVLATSVKAALRDDPRHPRACLLFLVSCVRLRRDAQALQFLGRTGINRQNAGLLAVIARREPDLDKALRLLDQAAQPRSRDPMIPWTRAYLLRKRDPQAAIRHVTRALELDPSHANSYSLRASLYSDLKDDRRAEADFRASLKHQPTLYLNYINLASFLLARGRGAEAVRILKRATPHLKRNPAALLQRAALLLQVPANDAAHADLNAAIELLETQPERMRAVLTQGLALRAQARIGLGRLPDAEADLDRAFALRGRRLPLALRVRGDLRAAQNRHAEAAADYRAYLKQATPDDRQRARLEAYLRKHR